MERLEVVDTQAPSTSGTVPVRTYVPRVRRRPMPGAVFLHSCGFVLGSLEIEHDVAARLAAEADCVVVSVDYRLAPEHPYPAAPEDCHAALCWLADPAGRLDDNPERIAVAGHSAGRAAAMVDRAVSRSW
jgi:acetyl esterase/lipase